MTAGLATLIAVVVWPVTGAGATRGLAPAPPRLGSDGHGVRVDHRRGATFIYGRAAARRYRQIAGRKVDLTCEQLGRRGMLIVSEGDEDAVVRAPRHRAPIESGETTPSDLCTLAVLIGHGREQIVAIVALTRPGNLYLDQQRDVRPLVSLSYLLASAFAWSHDRTSILHDYDAVVLPGEHALPPGHRLGIYVHAGATVRIAQRDRAGALLFFDRVGGVISTDLLDYLHGGATLGPYLGQVEPVRARSATPRPCRRPPGRPATATATAWSGSPAAPTRQTRRQRWRAGPYRAD